MLPFSFPAVCRKKVTAAFDGGRISSDGGVLLLAEADRRLGLADKLAAVISDHRDPTRDHPQLADILRARILAIACGWEDGNDLDICGLIRPSSWLVAACLTAALICVRNRRYRAGRTRPALREIIRLMGVLVDLWCASYTTPPEAVTLDIDDTCDKVHGAQQMSLFNAHYDEHCFLPIHIYDTATSRPVAMILRPGKTPSGRNTRPSAPPGAPDPPSLAPNQADDPGRWPLWSS